MSFLAPWAVALAALVAVPLWVHLRRRETTRRIAFPAIRYLSQAREATARSLRTADRLLLAVRVALLLLLALAAAGPLIGRGGPAEHRPTDVAVVIDNTASSNRVLDETALVEHFVERARDLLDAAGTGDRFWVLPAVGPPTAAAAPAGPAREALDRVRASDGSADLRAAIALASAALPVVEGRAREVVWLGDLQASGLAGDSPAIDPPGTELPRLLVYRPPAAPTLNGAVAAIELESGSVSPVGLPQTLVAEIRRTGGEPDGPPATGPPVADQPAADPPVAGPPERVPLRLEVDGETAGAASVPWGSTTSFRLPDLAIGPHRGLVAIEPDGSRSDDVRHFAFRVVAPPRVRHTGPADSFVALALETLRAAGRIGAGPERVRLIEGAIGGDEDPTDPDPAVAVVLVAPRDPVDLPAFNQRLEREGSPWRLRPDTARGDLSLTDAAGVPGLAGARVRSRYLIEGGRAGEAGDGPVDPEATLLATADGRPWLLRHDAGGRRLLLLVSPLVPEATEVPASPAMIPLLEALLLRWSRPGRVPQADGSAGVAVTLPAWASRVRTPDGETLPVERGAPFVPFRAGAYEISGGDSERSWLAANVPEPEFDLAALEPSRLQELFPGREVDIAGPVPGEWRDALYRARRGVAATPWLVALALVAAALEAVLAAPGRERIATRPGARGSRGGGE